MAALWASQAGAVEWTAGVGAGYAFRSQSDGRNHGAAASVFLDVPLPGAFAVRPELISLGFGASKAAPHSLGLFAGALSLVYSFDDTEVQCLAAVGPLAGISVDDAAVGFRGGLLAAIGLRFAVAKAIDIEAKVSLPVVLYGPKGVSTPGQRAFADGSAVDFPLQTMFQLGVAVDLAAAVAALSP